MAHGGSRKGAGRPPGALNKITKEVRELAQEYTGEAIEVIVKIMRDPEHSGQLAAARELLDRGHGKPTQPVDGQVDAHVSYDVPWLKDRKV